MGIENCLAGKAALVTGGSRGIGAGIVRRLASEGADIAFTYLTGKDEASEVAREVRDMSRRAAAIEADLADPASAAAVVQAAAGELGKLDILVNNAGITFWAPLSRIPIEEFERVVAVDARAPFLMMQAAADTLSEGGRIINVSSAVTSTALAGSSLYSGVKAFLDQVTRVAAIEFAPRRITVNAVAPGTTATGRLQTRHRSNAGRWAPRLPWVASASLPTPQRSSLSWHRTRPASSPARSSTTTAGSYGRSGAPNEHSWGPLRRYAGTVRLVAAELAG